MSNVDGSDLGIMAAVVAGLFMVFQGLIEIIKKLLPQIFGTKCSLSEEQSKQLAEVHTATVKTLDIVSRTNLDGTPLCYHPQNYNEPMVEALRAMLDLQYKAIEKMGDIATKFAEITFEQKRMTEILDRLERRMK